jgi:hypothetical protein
VGAVGVAVLVFVDPEAWAVGPDAALGDATLTWLIVRNMLHVWLVARAVALEIYLAGAFSTLGVELGAVDLLDPEPLRPFGRRGLRTVLLWMIMASLHSLLYIGDWANYFLAPAVVSIVVFAFAALLLPVLGLRARLHAEKRAELARVREAIRELRDRRLEATADAGYRGGELADLLAYEARIRSAREWPFDVSSALRFALYLAIGLGSWLGGALVERALDVALD